MNRRDLLLQEMQIPQWVLRKPQVLKGEAAIRLPEQVKLVVICSQNYRQTTFFNDVLLALKLNTEQVQWLDIEQALRLDISHTPQFWLIEHQEQAVNFAKKFAHHTAWYSESWQALTQSKHKRQLWQQMQHFLAENE